MNEAMLAVFAPKYRSPIFDRRYETAMNLICTIMTLLTPSIAAYYISSGNRPTICGGIVKVN